jgi:hypothetical protein
MVGHYNIPKGIKTIEIKNTLQNLWSKPFPSTILISKFL